MSANNSGRNRRDYGNWQGRSRGQGRGRGRGGPRPYWNKQKQNEISDKNDNDGSMKTDSNNGHYFKKTDKQFSYSQFIPESDLGITEYICKETKISGILKQMFSDFIVHEIDPEGNVVKLTNQEVPEETETVNSIDGEKDSIIPDDKWKELADLLENPKETKKTSQEVKIDVTDMDKDSRGKTHAAIRKAFGRKLQSNTQDLDGKKIIVVKNWTGSDKRGNWTRGKDKDYLYFTVHKQDMDTTETVNRISGFLRLRPSNLNFAGTKDRRACTSQRMSLWHGEPKRLKNLNIRNVWIGNYEFKGQTIKLGQLKGNLFSVALREILNSAEEVDKNMMSLKEHGFINYFGTQRFGTNKNAPTHIVGKALLQGDWEKAVNLILQPRDNLYGVTEALQSWQKEKDGKKAYALVEGFRSSIEVSLLRGLANAAKNDYLKALNELPRNLRLLYLHAYQSYIWNRIVSRRIRQFGLKTLPGDLVLVEGSTTVGPDADTLDELEPTPENEKVEPETEDEKVEPETQSDAAPSEQEETAKVRVISAEEAEKIPIEQIILPTPGFKITLPDNELKKWYSEMLAEDGLTIESLRQKSKEYSVGGSYRNIISKPTQLEWKIVRYKNPQTPLLRTDVEEMHGKPQFEDDPEGTLRALIVTIGLDTSTYATIALREAVDYVGAIQKKHDTENPGKKGDENPDAQTKVESSLETPENDAVNESAMDTSEPAERSTLSVSKEAAKRQADAEENSPAKKAKVEE